MTNKFVQGAIAFAMLSIASPAIAGACPAGQAGSNALTGHPTAPKGVTDTVVAAIDVAKDFGIESRNFRMRRLIVQPGGIVPFHSHHTRPALIATIRGTISEYRTDCRVPVKHSAGEVVAEGLGLSHYWVNEGSETVELLSADLLPTGE